MKTFCIRKGQTTAEYAVVIGVVVAAIVAMQVYVKRGLQAKMKGAADHLTNETGELSGLGTTSQYEPYYTQSAYDVTQTRSSTDELLEGGGTKRAAITETTQRTGVVTTGAP